MIGRSSEFATNEMGNTLQVLHGGLQVAQLHKDSCDDDGEQRRTNNGGVSMGTAVSSGLLKRANSASLF